MPCVEADDDFEIPDWRNLKPIVTGPPPGKKPAAGEESDEDKEYGL